MEKDINMKEIEDDEDCGFMSELKDTIEQMNEYAKVGVVVKRGDLR